MYVLVLVSKGSLVLLLNVRGSPRARRVLCSLALVVGVRPGLLVKRSTDCIYNKQRAQSHQRTCLRLIFFLIIQCLHFNRTRNAV